MTVYKLYVKTSNRETELSSNYIITGNHRLNYTKPGREPSELYSHYETELFCLCVHGDLVQTFWCCKESMESLDYYFECRYVSESINEILYYLNEIVEGSKEKIITQDECHAID